MRGLRLALLMAMLCLVAGGASALARIPDETGYVTDQTGVIEPAAMAQLQLRLAKYHIESHRKISVLLVQATPDEELEAFADRVLDTWGLDRERDGGALLLWSAEGYVLIRATDSLLPALGGEAQAKIISRWIVPAFAEGDASRGIRDGVERMIAVIAGEPVGERPVTSENEMPPFPEQSDPVDDGDSATFTIAPPSRETAPWVAQLPDDLARFAEAFGAGAFAGLRAVLSEAGSQWEDLPVAAQVAWLQLRGERVEPPLPVFALNALCVFAGVLGLAALLLLRGVWSGAALLVSLAGAPALWAATGFTALALCLLVGALLLPAALRVLRALLGAQDESDSEARAAAQLKAQLAALASRPHQAAATHAPTSPLPTPREAGSATRVPSVLPASVAARRAGPPNAQALEEFTNLLAATFRHALSRARLWHLGLAVALFITSAVLAVLALLALAAYFAVRRGVVRKFLELGTRQDEGLRRLLERLPAPDPADLRTPAPATTAKPPGPGGR